MWSPCWVSGEALESALCGQVGQFDCCGVLVSESAGNNQRSKLVAATANRLRLVQSDFADEPEQVRKDYLSDEIQRALGTLIPNERKAFLEELKQFFPTWDAKVEVRT